MNIHAVKIGTTVNISINGKLHRKVCGSPEQAIELFDLVLKAKSNPIEGNVRDVMAFLNEGIRIAHFAGLETNIETGDVFMAGLNTPIPKTLLEVIREYHENEYPMDSIINFWKLLMINPDVRIRESLFDFIKTHDFVLTDTGYMVVYKAVYRANDSSRDNIFEEFINNQYLHVKKDWKCSPNKYVAYRTIEDGSYAITKIDTATNWDEKERGIEILGKLGELFDVLFNSDVEETDNIYTDMYSQTMKISLGKPVQMDRKECDGDPSRDCSYGLHVGATKYVENFAGSASAILVCLINPANVVAVPQYDHSKIRVSEYFPFAIASYENQKIDIIEQPYLEMDYHTYEIEELEKQIHKVKATELPVEKAINGEEETRSMSELMKILQNRLVDIKPQEENTK